MRLTIPLTGTVIREGSVHGDGLLVGAENDPIKPINIPLGNHISWTMVDVDLDNEVMIIDIQPEETVEEPTGETTSEGDPVFSTRKATKQEKQGWLQQAKYAVESHTKEELYAISGHSKLKRPFKKK